MKIKDKIMLDREELEKEGAINIAVFGDSVTHGAVNGYMDYENVYHNILKKKLNKFRDYMPVNIINAGIGGATAKESVARLKTQVLCHNPDLIIVSFGLNDVNFPLEEYLSALEEIFKKCADVCDVIFMTPNMLNLYVADDTPKQFYDYAKITAKMQNEGKMDLYMQKAVELAEKMGICVCDCYSKWKKLSETEDTTLLLANRINHPVSEMHNLFADSLYEIIMGNVENTKESDTAMLKM